MVLETKYAWHCVGEARADAFGPELVVRSDDAWRMRSNAVPSIYNMRVSTVKACDRPRGLGKAQHSMCPPQTRRRSTVAYKRKRKRKPKG